MPHDHGTRARAPQETVHAGLARLVETTYAVCEDATLPAWRRHHALVQLAESAMLLGRNAGLDTAAVAEALDHVHAAPFGEGT